ncbi:unnamed protein product [Amoebophrya sp. A25]|nr:unnamed protein product [Amoebophrya sp. A25]|eukprot:GSA25T00020296001.1
MPFSLPHRRLPHGRLSASATWSSRSLASTSLSLPRGVTATKDPHSEDGAEEMRGVKTTTSVVAVVGDTDHQSHELKEKYNINCEVEGAKIGDRDDRDTGHSSRTSISTRTVSTETSLSAETSNSTFDISTIVEDVRASTSAVQEKKNYVHEAITSRGRTDDDGNPSGAGTSGSSKTSRGPRSGSHEDDKRRVVVDPVFLAEDSGRPPVLGNAEGETPYWSPETGFVPRHSAAAWHWLGDPVRSGLQNPEQDVLKYKGDAYSEQIGSGVFGWEDFPASSSETDQLCISPPEAGGSSSSGEAGSAIDEATSEFGLPLSLENSHFATQIRTAKDNTRLTSALLMCAEKRALLSIGFEKIQIVVDEVIGKICPGCLVFTIPYGSAVTGCLLEESSDLDVGIRVVPDRMGLRLADAKLEILSQLRNRLEDIGFARLDLVPARVPVLRCALREYSDYEADNVHSSLRAEFDISLHVDDYVFWNSVLLQQCLAQDWWTAEAAAEIHDDICGLCEAVSGLMARKRARGH